MAASSETAMSEAAKAKAATASKAPSAAASGLASQEIEVIKSFSFYIRFLLILLRSSIT